MIPRAHITAWRSQAPWPTDAQVEQDLLLTRALIEIFKLSAIAGAVAFRGGTALHKLYLPSKNYSAPNCERYINVRKVVISTISGEFWIRKISKTKASLNVSIAT